jgi:hypothetical protein
LSRGGGRQYGQRAGKEARIRVYADLSGVYDNGIFPVTLTPAGTLGSGVTLAGAEVNVGAYGFKQYRRTQIGLDYRGGYRHYPTNTFFNGSDHFLGLDARHQASKHVQYTGNITAGTTNRVFGFANFINVGGLNNLLPFNDIFDNRMYFLHGTGQMNYQVNARLILTASGEAFAIRRNSTALVGSNGVMPRGAITYRLSRRLAVGSTYQFFHLTYPRAFGEAQVHNAMGFVTYQLNKIWSAEVAAGAFRMDVAGTRVVRADPVVAQLLGIENIAEAFSRVTTQPSAQAVLNGAFRRTGVNISYARLPAAGNGLTLAGSSHNFSASLQHQPNNRTSFSLTSSYNRFTSVDRIERTFTTVFGGVGGTYKVSRAVQVLANASYRHADFTGFGIRRNAIRLQVGIVLTPSDVPLVFW